MKIRRITRAAGPQRNAAGPQPKAAGPQHKVPPGSARRAVFARALAAVLLGSAALAACSQDGTAGGSDRVQVVASTNVWASVATAVGREAVEVKAIISDAGGDPHSYQMTPRDAAALTGAELIVVNGGGYDEFVGQSLGEARQDGVPVIEAFALAKPAGDNEHVWYQLSAVAAVAGEVAARLAEIAPAAQGSFQANLQAFRAGLDELAGQVEQIAQADRGARVVATEQIARYLLDDAGLQDVTPRDFLAAVEDETDPPAAAIAQMQRLVGERQVTLVVHNPQTETPAIIDVLTRAREAGLPLVQMTETLPAGQDYLTWMTGQIQALSSALGQR